MKSTVDRSGGWRLPRNKARQPRPWTERSEGSGSALARRKASARNSNQRYRQMPPFQKQKIVQKAYKAPPILLITNHTLENIDLIRPKNPLLLLSNDINATDSPRILREIFR